MRRVGLLGGTFDPPHIGHLVVADWAVEALQLDEVRLLVAGDPWMKQGESDAATRVALCEAAVAGHPRLVVDDREARRDGPTYTFDTLTELHDEDPDTTWVFLLGTDAAAHLPSWHRVDDAVPLAEWTVVVRPGTDLPDHRLAHALRRLDVPRLDVSSTGLRARVAAGHSIRFLVPDAVIAEVERRGLYRPSDD